MLREKIAAMHRRYDGADCTADRVVSAGGSSGLLGAFCTWLILSAYKRVHYLPPVYYKLAYWFRELGIEPLKVAEQHTYQSQAQQGGDGPPHPGVRDPGDVGLVPDPAYPVYATWARFCGAEVVAVPLREDNGFLPDLAAIPRDTARRAKLFWICYPNNPTAALTTRAFFDELARFALEHDLLIASDAAYSEIYFDCDPSPSFLQSPGAMECGIEFHSRSKASNMPGWQVGFAAGNTTAVRALRAVKSHTDSGIFGAIQHAAVAALTDTTGYPDHLRATYRDRMLLLCDGLEHAGLDVLRPRATCYCCCALPRASPARASPEGSSTRPGY